MVLLSPYSPFRGRREGAIVRYNPHGNDDGDSSPAHMAGGQLDPIKGDKPTITLNPTALTWKTPGRTQFQELQNTFAHESIHLAKGESVMLP